MTDRIICCGILTAAYFSLFIEYGFCPAFFTAAVLLSVLLFISFVDIEERRVPHKAVLLCAGTHLAHTVARAGAGEDAAGIIAENLAGTVYMSAFLAAVLFFELCLGKKLLGGGDLRLLILLGAHLGAGAVPALLFFVCVFALPAAAFPAGRKNKKGTIAMVPAIFLAAWAVLLL